MKKRALSIVLVLCMVAALLPTSAFALKPTGGTCGENLTWNLDANGILTISGTGAMTDYDYLNNTAPWCEEEISRVIIETGITRIGAYAFYNCTASEITIPSGITSIREGTFYSSSFNHITIPEGVTSIGGRAFFNCSLASISLPKTLSNVTNQAFYMSALKDVYYAGSEEDWENVYIGSQAGYNSPLVKAKMHYNSTGPDNVGPVDPDTPESTVSVYFLSDWNAATRSVQFGDNTLSTPDKYTVADSVDVSNISSLLNKYVLVTMEQGDSVLEYTITDIQPVESKIGTVSATGEHSLTIDGTTYPVREDYVLALYDGKEVLYHVFNGTIMGFDVLEEKTGTLEAWDEATGRAIIGGTVYPTNFLSDVSKLNLAIGKKITYYLVNTNGYSPLMKYTILDVPYEQEMAAMRVGEERELLYWFENADGTPMSSIDESNIRVSVEDETVLYVEKAEYKRTDNGPLEAHCTVKANHTGTTTITVYVDGVAVKQWEIQVEIDRWEFVNANDKPGAGGKWPHAGGYYITHEDCIRLISNLDSKEKHNILYQKIFKEDSILGGLSIVSNYHNPNFLLSGAVSLYREWTGSCDGMSRWACLVGAKVLSPELVKQKTLYEAKQLSPEIQSAINYYHNQQYLSSWKAAENQFMSHTQIEQLNHLEACAIDAERSGNPIYIGVQWYETKEDGNLKNSSSSHAIVGYGIEDGFWSFIINGSKFDFTHRVLIYDCATGSANVFDYNLYYNDSYAWGIPGRQIISKSTGVSGKDNNAQFRIVTNDTSLINLINYPNGELSNAGGTSNFVMLSAPSDKIYTVACGKDMYKIDGLSVLESSGNKEPNIILDCNTTPTGESVPANTTVILPDTNGEYTVTTEENTTGFSLDYGNYLESATLSSSGSITFKPNGSLTIQATEATDYGLSITANEGYTPLPWHTISFTGSNATEVSTESVTEGIILHSDNLNNVTVYGTDDNETKELKFSTQEDSVLITEKSDELVILIDTDNDGTYETPVEEESSKVTITFDANGGTVTPDKATAGEDGKVSTLPVPTRSGYTFDGWFTSASGGEKITTDYVFTSDTTLYAHWTKNSGGSSGGNSSGGGSSSGGSSSTNYSITAGNFPHGSINVSPKSASKGTKVTITIRPDQGYTLDDLAVKDANGNSVKLVKETDVRYTFIMPGSKVTIDATFSEIEQHPSSKIDFTDVSVDAYYYDAVAWAVEKGITVGTSATTFSPDAPCTRAQIVTFLWRAAGSPSMGGSNPFTDVAPGSYYYDAVQWAVTQGITVGTSTATFSPDATCTRGQTVAFLYRYEKSPAISGGNAFTDVPSDAYYTKAVQWAVNNGVTAGTSATTFSPSDTCTRAQIVTFLYRDMA